MFFQIIKKLILISLYLIIALPGFIFPIKFGIGSGLSMGLILMYLLLILFMFLNFKLFINKIQNLLSFTFIKILFLFFTLNFLLIIIHTLLGDNEIIKPILSYFYKLLMTIVPMFFGFYIVQFFKPKKLIRIYYIILYLVLIFGIFEFIIFFFHITILENIYNYINNIRTILDSIITRAYVGVLPRIQSGFDEPAYFAFFLNVHLPIIYNLSFSKFAILKNKYSNFIVKKSFPILLWFIILGIQSPIHIIISSLITICYIFIKLNRKKRLFFSFSIFGFIITFVCLFINVDLSNTFLGRIQSFIFNFDFTNINTLIFADESLGTRLISYINMICVFLAHPFIGCGTGNFPKALTLQSLKSPVPYTSEYARRMAKPGFVPSNYNILYTLLAELGFIVTIIFYAFIINLIINLKNISTKTHGIYKDLFQGFYLSLIVYIVLNFYESIFYYFWVEFGLIIGLLYIFKSVTKRKLINENINN